MAIELKERPLKTLFIKQLRALRDGIKKVKIRLIRNEFHHKGQVCAMGVLGVDLKSGKYDDSRLDRRIESLKFQQALKCGNSAWRIIVRLNNDYRGGISLGIGGKQSSIARGKYILNHINHEMNQRSKK